MLASCTPSALYIEDDETNRRLMERILAFRGGVEMLEAASGAEGVDVAAAGCPAVILLDMHLPDAGGEQVLARLRGTPATATVPVIAVSGDADPDRIDRVMAAGAAAYLAKPIDIRQVIAAVDRVLLDGEAGEGAGRQPACEVASSTTPSSVCTSNGLLT